MKLCNWWWIRRQFPVNRTKCCKPSNYQNNNPWMIKMILGFGSADLNAPRSCDLPALRVIKKQYSNLLFWKSLSRVVDHEISEDAIEKNIEVAMKPTFPWLLWLQTFKKCKETTVALRWLYDQADWTHHPSNMVEFTAILTQAAAVLSWKLVASLVEELFRWWSPASKNVIKARRKNLRAVKRMAPDYSNRDNPWLVSHQTQHLSASHPRH